MRILLHFRRVLCVVSVSLLLAGAAFAQAAATPKYDVSTETKLKGVVEDFQLLPPSGPKPQARLVLKSGTEDVQVYLCPKSFLDDMGVTFKKGDEIQVTGSRVKVDGSDLTLAREVTKGEDKLILRFDNGKPAW
ncbi:MAG TPA: hypothetical protein VKW78_10690 [Terriglobales bacterium]|nr:hypothetical protein [Terriglobales bacterium]